MIEAQTVVKDALAYKFVVKWLWKIQKTFGCNLVHTGDTLLNNSTRKDAFPSSIIAT